jgi:protein TonB
MKTAWFGSMAFHLALAGGLLWVAVDRPPARQIGLVGAVTVALVDASAVTFEAGAPASMAPSVEPLRAKPNRVMAPRHDSPQIQPVRAESVIEAASSEPTAEPPDLSSTPTAVTTVEPIGATPANGADAGSTETASAGGTVVSADPWPAYFAAVRDAVERVKHYPFSARLAGLEDHVAVNFFIAADGAADQIRLTEPSRFPVLNDAAVDTIRRVTRFPAPPLRDSQSGVRVTVPLEFTLHNHQEAQQEAQPE